MSESDEKTCSCGHGIDHYMVSADRKYTVWGGLWLVFGVSAVPIRLRYRCRLCNEIIEETTDPERLRAASG